MSILHNLVFILLICVSRVELESKNNHYGHLKAVAVLFRHGDRAPVSSFPTDMYFNEIYWPMGFGQLTNKGKNRLYLFGKWLRERYNGFLSETYSSKDTYVFSSDSDRTLSSAAAVLAGLYPPKSGQIWNEKLQWQPIPIHTRAKKDDQILAMEAPCPKYNSLLEAARKSQYYQNINREYSGFYDLVSSYTGWNINDVSYFAILSMNLQCSASANQTWIPAWVNGLDRNVLEYLAAQAFARYTFTKKMKRLGDGIFFDYLFSFFDKIIREESKQKFLMLSGHQDNIVSILSGMEIYDYLVPEFGSALIWELYEYDSGGYHLDLLYKRNQTHVDELQLKECAKPCLYAHFKGYLSNVTVNQTTWVEECNL